MQTNFSFSYYLLVIALYLFVLSNAAFATDPTLAKQLRNKIDQLHATHQLLIGKNEVVGVKVIQAFYSRRNFEPAWNDKNKIEELLSIIRNISDEGLNPEDYNLHDLETLHAITDKSIAQLIDFDILLSDSLLQLGFQVRFGKVDPNTLDPNWNLTRDLEGKDPATVMQAAINSDSLQHFIDATLQRQPFYQRLKIALVKYNHIKAQGGWPTIPKGPTLKPGMTDQRVLLLRKRLRATGDLLTKPTEQTTLFDDHLKQAVTRLQTRHGLKTDGLVGRQTLNTMNVSVDERIDQIRINLERGRWLLRDLQDDYVIVNIAGFRAFLFRSGKEVWRTKVMVGKTFRQTPVFKAQMKYLVFNPTWTIPPGIMRKDILPKARDDSEYIRNKGYQVLDRNGTPVNYDAIDWPNITPQNFPYIVRQPAGPNNALGQVKFIFPNTHFVFLHDTNHRNLFTQPNRAFSSGCIRVENPLTLAELILDNPDKWNQKRFARIIKSGNTQTVRLEKPLSVLLLYWTFMANEDGSINFFKDIYKRDKKILDALNAEFVPSAPANTPEVYKSI